MDGLFRGIFDALLAVFCGFLAEYQLEHLIEHQREKRYMKTMVEDLKKDAPLVGSVPFLFKSIKNIKKILSRYA